MKEKIIISVIIFFMIIFGYLHISNAAISAESKEVQSGEQFTISVNSNVSLASYSVKADSYFGLTFVTSTGGTGAGTTSVSNAVATGGVTNLATFTFEAPEVTNDTTYTIKFVATGMGDENLQPVDNSETTVSVTVKAKETTNNSNTSTGGTTNSNSDTNNSTSVVTKSSEARLSNLGIKPNDFSGFKKDKTEYSTEVPNSVTSVEVYATAVDSKATIIGTGKVDLQEGDNRVKVKVTAEDGTTTKTYTLTIKRKTAEEVEVSSEARLKTLGIKPEKYDFSGFNSDKTEYSVEVPDDVEEIEIYATAIDSKAQIEGTGVRTLEEGENELNVEVIAEDGTKNTYTIKVTREESDETEGTTVEKFGLSTLKIEGLTLSPSFKVGTYEYTVELEEDLSSLEIEAEANEEDTIIEIIGNENLQEGENVITILVTSKKTEEVVTYQIIVNKKLVEEAVQTSWLKPSTWGREEKIKIAIIIVLIILIICAIILKIKIGKENKKSKNRDFPGADELDKAIAEHQELSGEEINEMTETEQEEIQEQNEQQEEVSREENMQNYLEEIAKNRLADEKSQYDIEEKTRKRGKGRHF